MSMTIQTKNLHLMWRAGFGPAVEQLGDLNKYSPKQFYKALQKASEKRPEYIDVADDYLKGLMLGIEEAGRQQKKEMDEDQRKQVQQKNRQGVRNLNMFWMHEMVNTGAQLREKLGFFWHGHFACRNLNVFYQQGLLDIIRRNALGSFRTMLHEVSKSAAMLNFLNNQQNRKDHPNENFAREVMELFTLGRGNYTEEDIKEAARSFTGWSSNVKGEYVFRRFQHDFGSKTFLGKTGNLTGEEVLDHLLAQKQTARFITQKMYKFFVNDTPDQKNIEWLADRFYKNDYDIGKLCEDIFTSDWFYDDKNIGVKIKSPVELLTGIQRMLPMTLENEESLMLLQRVLGQLLFYPPNVAGWPGGKAWIDSSTLMMRMRIPQMLNDQDEMNVKPKDDDDTMMGRKNDKNEDPKAKGQKQMGKLGKPILVNIDWTKYVKNFDPVKREKLLADMNSVLLVTNKAVSDDLVKKFSDESGREDFIKSATIQIMSTPEYQLC
ncbi:MAG: DUF1800 domain-containing protein [Bacteroidetes bacterium]|nr:MAG: DUF1800 domain-containing protein [Bacteroidota bacterium]